MRAQKKKCNTGIRKNIRRKEEAIKFNFWLPDNISIQRSTMQSLLINYNFHIT